MNCPMTIMYSRVSEQRKVWQEQTFSVVLMSFSTSCNRGDIERTVITVKSNLDFQTLGKLYKCGLCEFDSTLH